MTSQPLNKFDRAERDRIGATIRQYRQMRGLTSDQLATKVGVSRPYLANIEGGRKPLTEVLLARISDALAIPQIAIVRDDYFEDVA